MVDVRPDSPRFEPVISEDPRLRASVERLLRDDYDIAAVMRSTLTSDWPGDLAGRLLLSLARYGRAGMPTLERADELNDAMLEALLPLGYLGPEVGPIADEQQVACHGWVVAGLLQYFFVTGDARSRTAALRVVDELIVPALIRRDYPWVRQVGADVGDPSGTATEVIDGWSLSSDVWCVLLSLNALVPAAIESGRADLADLIRELVVTIAGLDVVAQRAQLHAVLAAARTLADWAVVTGDRSAGDVAASLYREYERAGQTLNHATYNWFGRPDSWTEPCAIVDSIGAATALHALTGDPQYRIDAARIARNGLAFAERLDGSFGLDTIATPDAPILAALEPDAHWCCTIRGAIGLLESRETAAFVLDGRVVLTDLYPGVHVFDTRDGRWRIRVSTGFPNDGSVSLRVDEAPAGSSALEVDIAVEGFLRNVRLQARAGDSAVVPITLLHRREQRGSVDLEWVGPVLLTRDADDADAAPRPLWEIAGSFPGVDGPRLRLTLDAEGRR